MRIAIILILLAALALGAVGIKASDLHWPLSETALITVSLYGLVLVVGMGLLMLLTVLVLTLSSQQRALQQSLGAQMDQQRSLIIAQLTERFVQQAETLLEKESLDPNKRSVQRCLAVDALRGNSGRSDPNYQRLGRLFEWLAEEADAAQDDESGRRLFEPVLRHYAEIADQLCRINESDEKRLEAFLRYQPQVKESDEETA
ncbi:hypothetical protein [Halomonas sp. PR-M31]|uniref:hypothetical protein n=1 Tax=Halomonas sp. PR-M31 TaxID=1471202 RepID=UPI0006525AC5|nr:hypothetical protein [Halomonas sp. PR-M31]